MNWYAFRTLPTLRKVSAEVFASYSGAVGYCQTILQTEQRPKRQFDGLYKLRNTQDADVYRAYYICRADKMQAYEFGDVLELVELHA